MAGASDLVEIARVLNRGRVCAAPCPWLPAISIFDAEDYENYDLDMIGPLTRLRIIKILEPIGIGQVSGNVLAGPAGQLEFPRPTRSLASDPGGEVDHILAGESSVIFATPTQVLLATWRREGPDLSPERQADLVSLVRAQPANLQKIWGWLSRTPHAESYRALLPRLDAAQREGTELRRSRASSSRVPR